MTRTANSAPEGDSETPEALQAQEIATWNIYQRLHAIMAQFTYLQKEKKDGMKYTIVSHDKVTATLAPLLVQYRVICRPYVDEFQVQGNQSKVLLAAEFVNIDNPDDTCLVRMAGLGNDPQDKGPGKAMSYAWKYAALKMFAVVTGDDADHDSIETNTHSVPDASTAERGTTPRLTQPGASTKGGSTRSEGTGAGGVDATDTTASPAATISAGQVRSLWVDVYAADRFAGMARATVQTMFRNYLGTLGVESTKDITTAQLAGIGAWLREE